MRKAIAQTFLIATVALAAAGGTYLVKGPPSRVVHCDPATLKPGEICLESIPANEEILWVDARHRADWEKTGVPGSILWSLDSNEDALAFEAEAAQKIVENPQRRVVVYCGDENCGLSKQVADRIRMLDLGPQVYSLRGGWRALKDAGKIKDSSSKP